MPPLSGKVSSAPKSIQSTLLQSQISVALRDEMKRREIESKKGTPRQNKGIDPSA